MQLDPRIPVCACDNPFQNIMCTIDNDSIIPGTLNDKSLDMPETASQVDTSIGRSAVLEVQDRDFILIGLQGYGVLRFTVLFDTDGLRAKV